MARQLFKAALGNRLMTIILVVIFVAKLITFPVEVTMRGLTGIKEIRSISRFGLSSVSVYFEEQLDIPVGGDNKFVAGQVEGDGFTVSGLAPGHYVVTAQSTDAGA